MACAHEDRVHPVCEMRNSKSWHSYDGIAMSLSSPDMSGRSGIGHRYWYKVSGSGSAVPCSQSNGSKLRRTTSKVLEKMSRLGKRNRAPAEKMHCFVEDGVHIRYGRSASQRIGSGFQSSSDEEDQGKDDRWLYEPANNGVHSSPSDPAIRETWRRANCAGTAPTCHNTCSLPVSSPLDRSAEVKVSPRLARPTTSVLKSKQTSTSSLELAMGGHWWTSGSTSSLPLALIRSTEKGLKEEQCHCPACCRCGSSFRLLPRSAEPVSASATLPRTVRRSCALRRSLHIERVQQMYVDSRIEHQNATECAHSPLFALMHRTSRPSLRDMSTDQLDDSLADRHENTSAPSKVSILSEIVDCSVDSLLEHSDESVNGDLGIDVMITSDNKYDPDMSSSKRKCHWLDGHVVKDRMETMVAWFEEFNNQQRNVLLRRLLQSSSVSQMHFLSMMLEPVLHKSCPHNCQDLLSWLPVPVSLHVLSFLDPTSLCRASQVSVSWYHLANEPSLWRAFCRLPQWQLSDGETRRQYLQYTLADGNVEWKLMFSERFRLRCNWLQGRYTVRTFAGHTSGISCVQFDDTRIVSGSSDRTIKVWDIRTNTPWCALTLVGHSATVRCLHLCGNQLVSGSADCTIKVWDLSMDGAGCWSSAACRVTMVGHLHTVRCLQVDDEKIVSGSYDQTLKVWDLKTGRCRFTLRGHTGAVICLQFNETKIVSGSADKSIKVWRFKDGVCLMTLSGHQDAVTCLQFDAVKIISGSVDYAIKFWDICTGTCVQTLDWISSEGHRGVVRDLQADNWKIVTAADDKTLKVWSLDGCERLLTLRCHTDGVTCLQFNDRRIVSGSYDKTVKLYDFAAC